MAPLVAPCTLSMQHSHKYQPSARSQLIPLRTMAEGASEKLMDTVADRAWRLLQHYVCRDYRTSQRGSGVGGIHTRHNAHQIYPVHPLKEHTAEQQQAEERKPSVSIKMISPAQATLEQAKSELKEGDTVSPPQSQSRHQTVNTRNKIKKGKKKSDGTIFA